MIYTSKNELHKIETALAYIDARIAAWKDHEPKTVRPLWGPGDGSIPVGDEQLENTEEDEPVYSCARCGRRVAPHEMCYDPVPDMYWLGVCARCAAHDTVHACPHCGRCPRDRRTMCAVTICAHCGKCLLGEDEQLAGKVFNEPIEVLICGRCEKVIRPEAGDSVWSIPSGDNVYCAECASVLPQTLVSRPRVIEDEDPHTCDSCDKPLDPRGDDVWTDGNGANFCGRCYLAVQEEDGDSAACDKCGNDREDPEQGDPRGRRRAILGQRNP
jgi:hypothetical protein